MGSKLHRQFCYGTEIRDIYMYLNKSVDFLLNPFWINAGANPGGFLRGRFDNITVLTYIFGQTGLNKQYRSRSDAAGAASDQGLHCLPLTQQLCTHSHIHVVKWSTVLSTSLGKTFFAWRFILSENILFWIPYLIRNHLSILFLCFVLKYVP